MNPVCFKGKLRSTENYSMRQEYKSPKSLTRNLQDQGARLKFLAGKDRQDFGHLSCISIQRKEGAVPQPGLLPLDEQFATRDFPQFLRAWTASGDETQQRNIRVFISIQKDESLSCASHKKGCAEESSTWVCTGLGGEICWRRTILTQWAMVQAGITATQKHKHFHTFFKPYSLLV